MNSRIRSKPISLIAVFLAVILMSCSPVENDPDQFSISLEGEWKRMHGNRPEYALPGYNDQHWSVIQLPDRNLMPENRAHALFPAGKSQLPPPGFNWFRKTIHLDQAPTENLLLQIREIMSADRVFVNGKLVGSTGGFPPNFRSGWLNFRSYELPAGLLRNGENLIAIQQFFDAESWISAPMEIVSQDYGAKRKLWYDLLLNQFAFACSVILLGTSLFFFYFYSKRRKELEYLFLALPSVSMLLAFLLHFFDNYYAPLPVSSDMIMRISQSGLLALLLFISFFFHFYSDRKIRLRRVLLTSILPVSGIVLMFSATSRQDIMYWRNTFLGLSLILFVDLMVHLVSLLRQKRFEGIIMFLGVVPVLALGTRDIMVFGLGWVEGNTPLYTYGLPIMVVVVAIHLVDRFIKGLAVVEKANLSLKHYQTIFDNATNGIFRTDEDGAFLAVNPAMLTILGYKTVTEFKESCPGIVNLNFTDPSYRSELTRLLASKKKSKEVEFECYHQNKTVVTLSMNIHFASDRVSGVTHAEGIIEDISTKKERAKTQALMLKTKDELVTSQQAAIDNLKKAEKIKDEFLSITSHELRTPLNGIIGLAEILLHGAQGKLSETDYRYLSIIAASSKRLSRLVNDILDYSKIKNNELSLKLGAVDLFQLTEVVILNLEPLIYQKPVEFKNEIPSTIPLVRADEDRLLQVLYNLVGNAIKFTSEGTIAIRAARSKEWIRVTVSDNGVGIPFEAQQTIFESYKQADEFIASDYGGTGLGLAVTKSIVEMHGGTIEVESIPGKGADFSFTIPLLGTMSHEDIRPEFDVDLLEMDASIELQATSSFLANLESVKRDEFSSEREPPDLQGVLVMAVDDDLINLQVIESNLGFAGAATLSAASGSDCLKILENNKPDIVLLDVMMPGLSGYETAKIIRQSYSKEELPIIFLTARNQIDDFIAGFKAEANDFLTKPFSQDELLIRIDFHVGMANVIQNLKKAEQRIRQITDNAGDGIFQLSPDHTFLFANPAMAKLFGFASPAEMLASADPVTTFFTNPEEFISESEHLAQGQRIEFPETRLVSKNGSDFWGCISFQPNQDESVLADGMVIDITDRRERQKAERDREAAEQANRLKSLFLTNMSHELRTPLHGIIGYSKLGFARLEQLNKEKIGSYFESIYKSGLRLLALLNNILDLSKLEAGKADFVFKREKLSKLTADTIVEFATVLNEKSIEVTVQSSASSDEALMDKAKIVQVLGNLLSNSIKFSDPVSTIAITIEIVNHHLQFSIADQGIGIPMEEMDAIFDKFVQSSKTVKRSDGTGLGLAICREIIAGHNGKIWAEANPDGGTILRFMLPVV